MLMRANARISERERRFFDKWEARLYVSAVSIWEMRLKFRALHPSGARKSPYDPKDVVAALRKAGGDVPDDDRAARRVRSRDPNPSQGPVRRASSGARRRKRGYNSSPTIVDSSGTPWPSRHSMSAGDDFIRAVVRADLAAGRHDEVVTRFPPEPNGYLHIGHAKSICLNFGVPQEFGGRCHMRFDDTNPTKEEHEFIEAIMEDVRWLGFDWDSHLYFASDHFERLYEWAEHLIRSGDAYVDDLSAEEIRAHRGTLTEPGRDSPYRTRLAAESLDLFRRMRAGEFPEGARVLRAKIDMASGNINMRDPVLYRILHAAHPRTGEDWCIYPTYDFAHGQSDAIEGVTHSLCTLEFEDHRPLYDWADRAPAGADGAAAVRVLAPQPQPHRALQAAPHADGGGGQGGRLGRPPDADPARPAPARRAAGGDPRFRGAIGHLQDQRQPGGAGHARPCGARAAEPDRAAPLRGAAAAQAHDRELPGRRGRVGRRPQQPRGPGRRHPAGPLRPHSLCRSRRLHGGPAQKNSSGWRRAARCGCATAIS